MYWENISILAFWYLISEGQYVFFFCSARNVFYYYHQQPVSENKSIFSFVSSSAIIKWNIKSITIVYGWDTYVLALSVLRNWYFTANLTWYRWFGRVQYCYFGSPCIPCIFEFQCHWKIIHCIKWYVIFLPNPKTHICNKPSCIA